MVKKRNLNETSIDEDAVIIGTEISPDITTADNGNPEYESYLSVVQELRKNEDIEGYILKDESKATVDLNDSAKIVEYAMLTSQAFESAEALSLSFNIGNIETVLIEGKNIKTLCASRGQNKLGIFMKKSADDASILEAILPQTAQ